MLSPLIRFDIMTGRLVPVKYIDKCDAGIGMEFSNGKK